MQEYTHLLRDVPNLVVIKGPTFLDLAMKPHAVQSRYLTIKEFLELCGTVKKVYLYALNEAPDQRPGLLFARFYATNDESLTDLVSDLQLSKTVLSPSFVPAKNVTFQLDMEKLIELKTYWGMAEAARQVGLGIINQLEAKDDFGNPYSKGVDPS